MNRFVGNPCSKHLKQIQEVCCFVSTKWIHWLVTRMPSWNWSVASRWEVGDWFELLIGSTFTVPYRLQNVAGPFWRSFRIWAIPHKTHSSVVCGVFGNFFSDVVKPDEMKSTTAHQRNFVMTIHWSYFVMMFLTKNPRCIRTSPTECPGCNVSESWSDGIVAVGKAWSEPWNCWAIETLKCFEKLWEWMWNCWQAWLLSRGLTYPPDKAYLKMIFLFPRWYMLISWRVTLHGGSVWHKFSSAKMMISNRHGYRMSRSDP